MKVTITSIKLRGPFKFFALSASALKIIKQLRSANCREFKKRGIWTMHYTMTLWNNEEELKQFARSGAHLEAMKLSAQLAEEIRTFTFDAEKLPDWKTAVQMLNEAKALRF